MSYFGLLNIGVTLILAMFVMASTFCRIIAIDMKSTRWRFVAPILLLFAWAVSVFMSVVGGDTPDWYQPFALLALSTYLWNNRDDWKGGVPAYMLRAPYYLAQFGSRVIAVKRVVFENVVIAGLTALTLGAAAVGAMDGRGEPIQIYSAQAEPAVVTPGSTIKIVYSYRRVRACSGYVDRFIMTREGEPAQTFGTTPIGASEVGKKHEGIAVTLKLDDLKPGAYVYRAVIYHRCPDAAYTSRSPDVPFVVAPATVQ